MKHFLRLKRKKRFLVIDDYDLLDNRTYDIERLKSYFDSIILIINKRYYINPTENHKFSFEEDKDIYKTQIDSFYSNKRKELASRVFDVLSVKNDGFYQQHEKSKYLLKFSRVIENNMSLFTLNPFMIINLSKYIYYFDDSFKNDQKNIFNDVFTANLTIQINKSAQLLNISNTNRYVLVLQNLAFHMIKK